MGLLLNTYMKLARSYPQSVRRILLRNWYDYLSRIDKRAELIFMNYAWADIDPRAGKIQLNDEDEPNRLCIQLYHHVASAVDLRGLDVLEVGCGRGGGASYIMRYLGPRTVVGVDITVRAIRFCNQHYRIRGLEFLHGNAESLQFADSSFDVVVNVESSHSYASMERFLNGVCRILRPGGCFLFCDLRPTGELEALHQHLRNTGLTLIKEERITPNVVRALELDSERRQKLAEGMLPGVFRGVFREIAGVKGTKEGYGRLKSGDMEYLNFVLRK